MTNDIEAKGLRLSVWAAAFMAVIGIGFYFPTRSQAILLDGLFSLVGFFVCLLTIKVARLVSEPDDEHFQFGYGAFEPMLNLGKGLMIAGVCIFAVVPAIAAMLQGGRPMQSGPAILYAVVAAGGCFAMWGIQRRRAKRVNSPLLNVDVDQWLMDGAISSVVALAFVAGAILQRGPLASWVDYLDPALVILLTVVTIRVPLNIIRTNLREVLLAVPPPDIQEALTRGIHAVLAAEKLEVYRLRSVKAGRSHMLLLHVLLDSKSELWSAQHLDSLRTRLHAAVPVECSPFSLDVVFTSNKRWLS